jgi:hypothetical protein
VNKEDAVTVRQDLVKLELRGSPRGAETKSALLKSKGPALSDQSMSLEPKLSKKGNSAPAVEEKKLEPPEQDQQKESLLLTQTKSKQSRRLSLRRLSQSQVALRLHLGIGKSVV